MTLTMHATWTCCSNVNWTKEVRGSRGQTYTVSYGYTPRGPYQYDWSCTCKGFKFRGTCRHIEEAKAERCGWNGELEVGAQADRDANDNPICPECGGPLTAVNVGV